MPHLQVNRCVVGMRHRSPHKRLITARGLVEPFDEVRLSTSPCQSTTANRLIANVHHRPRQEEPLSLSHIRRRLPTVPTVLDAQTLLLTQYDIWLERFHRAPHAYRAIADRKRRHKPMPLVVPTQ